MQVHWSAVPPKEAKIQIITSVHLAAGHGSGGRTGSGEDAIEVEMARTKTQAMMNLSDIFKLISTAELWKNRHRKWQQVF